MAKLQDVYQQLCYDMLEDNGLTLGIVTDQQFIDLANLTLIDFLNQTGLVKRIHTQTIFAGQTLYTIPDEIDRVDTAFVAGRMIYEKNVHSLNETLRAWRRKLGPTQFWHTDELPIKTIELVPVPLLNSEQIYTGSTDPPFAVFDTFTAPVETSPGTVETRAPYQHRGLTIIGSVKPAPITALGQDIPYLPDEWAYGYLNFGILERFFSGDNETKDPQRAAYCGAQYKEGIAAAQAITGDDAED